MNPNRKQFFIKLLHAVMIAATIFNLILPVADLMVQAQDTTSDTPAATDTPTDAPTDVPPTDVPTDAPTVVPTVAPTDVPTDVQPTDVPTDVVTSEATSADTAVPTEVPTDSTPTDVPTEQPTQPPTISVFQDDFQDANLDGWMLTSGWQVGVEGDNLFLTTANPNEIAAIANLLLGDFSFSARVRMTDANRVNFNVRTGDESYVVALDVLGNVSLSRGTTLLAQGVAIAPPTDGVVSPIWHTLNIQATSGLITVSVDGTQQIAYTDADPLPAGGIAISTDGANTGAVSIDQVVVGQPQVVVETPIVIPTEAPTITDVPTVEATEVVTTEPTVETTIEATTEATVEATDDATPEVTPEATIEATPTEVATAAPGQLILSTDFEGDVSAWTLGDGTSVVADGDTNHALLMNAGSTLFPAQALYLADFQLDARLNIVSDAQDGSPTGVSFVFRNQDNRGYVVSVEVGQTALYRNDGAGLNLLTSSPTAHTLNSWHTVSLNAQGGHIVVTVDGAVEVDYTDAEPLTNGQIAFIANGGSSAMLDDISVTDFTSLSSLAEVTPTASAAGLGDAERAKLTDVLGSVVDTFLKGDQDGALAQAQANFLPMDDQGRVSVIIWGADGQTGQALAPIVAAVGGQVDFVNDTNVQARVPLGSFVALVNTPQIYWIDITSQAVSTGNLAAPAAAPAGTYISEGYDDISANDWHTAVPAIMGSASYGIALIDTGFVGVADSGEWACMSGSIPTGGTNHGNMVLQVLCDIAPSTNVKLFKATDLATLTSAINTARADGTIAVILVTMDLGVDAAPGDGVGAGTGTGSSAALYTAIHTAHVTNNKLVVVSAGNNNGRQVNFNYATGGTTTIAISANAGDHVNVSWNDWTAPTAGRNMDMTLTDGVPTSDMNFVSNRIAGGAVTPSHQFVVPNDANCDLAPAAACSLTLTINPGSDTGYVQVQATGVGSVSNPTGTGFSNIKTTSTISRPGDSPDALTVGAVCAKQDSGYPLLDGSSMGPVMSAGGSGPVSTALAARGDFKPDLVGPSDVSTSLTPDPGGSCLDTDTTGFTGTSAAAAHVAAMAALIRSNANIGATTPDGITDYMQSHSIDLYEAVSPKPDGFDMAYGSGLAVLGDPKATVATLATNPTTLTDVICPAGGSSRYVSPYSLSVERNLNSMGTRANPYISAAEALSNAAPNDCVVLLPGEYISDLLVNNTNANNNTGFYSYSTLKQSGAASTFWINDSNHGGGIAISGGVSDPTIAFTISGFSFVASHPLGQRNSQPPSVFVTPNAIVFKSSSGNVAITNNTFTGFAESPISVSDSKKVNIQNNTFSLNTAQGGSALKIQGSDGNGLCGSGGFPVVVQNNSFHDNKYTGLPQFDPEAVVFIKNCAVNIFNNRFFNNQQFQTSYTSIVNVLNTDEESVLTAPFSAAYPIQMIGNAIFNNFNNGPVVYLVPSKRFRFVNNTVANNSAMNAVTVIQRSTAASPTNDSDGATEINNNLFYNNGLALSSGALNPPLSIFIDLAAGDTVCYDFSGTQDNGAKNNWSWQSGSDTGDCQNSWENAAGQKNDVNLHDPTNDFVTNVPSLHDQTLDDPYQLIGTSFGIDYGNSAFIPGGTITKDVLGHDRFNGPVDVGAYEFKIVSGEDFTVTIPEDTPDTDSASPINMTSHASGGFGPYSIDIITPPQNYSTDTTNACGGQPLALKYDAVTKITKAIYCPPANFYNDGSAPPEADVTFTYRVRDSSGTLSLLPANTATIIVNATPDVALTTPVLPQLPITYSVLTQAETPVTFRLRPYVKFQNFRLSENFPCPALPAACDHHTDVGADYPYSYSGVGIAADSVPPDPNRNLRLFDTSGNGSSLDEISAAFAAAASTGVMTLTPKSGEVGFLAFTYNATDSHTPTAGTETGVKVRLQVIGTIPDSGLHDDTSMAFTYEGAIVNNIVTGPGLWTPVYSETSINNTLHNTSTINDTAEFLMTGAGFALYMQGKSSAGSNWELQIDSGGTPITFTNWALNATLGRYVASSSGVTCTTAGTTATGSLISNKAAINYVVSCTGLLEDQANIVRLINRENKTLSVDAIGILRDTSPLLRGFHEVTEQQMIPYFFGWNLTTITTASGQRAMTTTNAASADIHFTFKGTGFAVGTALEKFGKVPAGATYDICVAPTAAPNNKVCQAFDNSVGASTAPLFNVFRPFFGYDPTLTYDVSIHLKTIPVGGRMVIDSIVVFDNNAPTAPLDFGTTEDDQLGPIVFGGGLEDTWSLNTNLATASNRSLTSIISASKAGPFVSFQIPATADTINWYRVAGATDSNKILVCVDRAQGDMAGSQATHCVAKDLKTAGNPVVIKASDFDLNGDGLPAGNGWGSAFGTPPTHTVEIFSLTNQPFNVDKIQIVNTLSQLSAGYYEENLPGIRYFTEQDEPLLPGPQIDSHTYTLQPAGNFGDFADVVTTLASGGHYRNLNADSIFTGADTFNLYEGMFFQFTGTGFAVNFVLNTKADAVRICWLNNIFGGNPDGTSVAAVLAAPTCQTFDNQSAAVRYKAGRTIDGLPFGAYSVAVQMLDDQGEPIVHAAAAKPIAMGIDSVEIFNHNPMPPNVLTALGTRYETSFTNQAADGRFVYIGTGWKSVTGTTAKLYSGSNYDTISNVIGAGIEFRTDGTSSGADSVIIYRDTRAAYAPMQICEDGGQNCTIVNNTGGTGNQQPIVYPLGSSGPHTVTIITADAGVFTIDAIELANNGPLTAGIYDENNAAITYSNTTNAIKPIRSNWTDIPLASYFGGGAMQSNTAGASMSFSFTGTGFSLISLFDKLSGVLNVSITGSNPYSTTFSSNNTATVYGAAHTFTGLPLGTYNVTITEADLTGKHKFTVDGIEIYGSAPTAMAPGIYDDAATDASSLPLISYGPNNSTWVAKTGTLAAGYMNLTNHLASRYGAHLDFQVQNAGYITLFHTGTLSLNLRVCVRTTAGTTLTCGTTTTAPSRSNTTISLNNAAADITLNAGGVGNYVVSVTNLSQAKALYLDAVGVYGAGPALTQGIYQENNPLLSAGFAPGTWGTTTASVAEATATDKFVRSTGTGDAGDQLNFSFTGTGFSIVLVQSTATSTSYNLCVTLTTSCDMIGNGAGGSVGLPITGATSVKRPVALTYVGFNSGTYSVKLTNNDSSKPLLVDRVDILGTVSQQIGSSVTGNVENTDARINYFPFFTYNLTAATGPSGGNQHTGTMQGSIVYFELQTMAASGFDYVRQTLSSYGTAAVCAGVKGVNSFGCAVTTVANNLAPLGYQKSANVPEPANSNVWVAIQNTDGKIMPLDYIRPRHVGQALTQGIFEENHPEMYFFTEPDDGLPPPNPTTPQVDSDNYTLATIADLDGNFTDLAAPLASGGSVKVLSADFDKVAAGNDNFNLFEGMLFQFNGTGFAVRFTIDNKADAVRICWLSGAPAVDNTLVDNVLAQSNANCQIFDNQSAAVRYQASRVIQGLGLAAGDYTVAVQMLGDNGLPALHTAATQPISMQIDGVQVFNDTLPTNMLTPSSTRYETSFVNAAANQQFLYYGNGWKSVSGTAAKTYSGSNYDSVANVIGAGVEFRTNGANAITLYRSTGAGYAPIQVCSAPTGDLTQRFCTTVVNTTPTGVQQPARILLNNPANPGSGLGQAGDITPHIVTITTTDIGTFTLDAIEVINTNAALQPGLYEDNYPSLVYTNPNLTAGETAWASVFATAYTGGRVAQTQDNDAQMNFSISNATGFEIGTAMDRYGGESQVCYNSANDNSFPAGPNTKCFTYEDERSAILYTVSRTVTGLDSTKTYAVRLKNVEDGNSIVTHIARVALYTPSRLRVDYVQVYGNALPPVTPAGFYNENAVNGSSLPYLQLLPVNRWFTFSGTAGKGFTFSTYAAVVDNSHRLSSAYAGPSATLQVQIPANSEATVILYTGTAVTTNTDEMLVCANNVSGADPVTGLPQSTDCAVVNLRTNNQIVVDKNLLPTAMQNGTGAPVPVTLTFRALNAGTFKIDSFQVISGTTLTPGFYDDALFTIGSGIINLGNVGATGLWTKGVKIATAFGGTVTQAQSTSTGGTTPGFDDPTLNFTFTGTGFSIVTQADSLGADMRICYGLTSKSPVFPASTVLNQSGNLNTTGTAICQTRSTDTTAADWKRTNGGQPLPTTVAQYGFTYDGLPNNTYTVEVRMVDTIVAATDRMKIDAVAIFGDVTGETPLLPGTLFDNTQAGLVLSPSFYWSQNVSTTTPTTGFWNKTETSTSAVGPIAQMYVQGNAVVLYQTAKSTGTRYARICLTTAIGQDCSSFSQNSAKTTYFTPIIFYGFGTGNHEVILENRDPGKFLSIDAIRILK